MCVDVRFACLSAGFFRPWALFTMSSAVVPPEALPPLDLDNTLGAVSIGASQQCDSLPWHWLSSYTCYRSANGYSVSRLNLVAFFSDADTNVWFKAVWMLDRPNSHLQSKLKRWGVHEVPGTIPRLCWFVSHRCLPYIRSTSYGQSFIALPAKILFYTLYI